jgi:hypothetical protein
MPNVEKELENGNRYIGTFLREWDSKNSKSFASLTEFMISLGSNWTLLSNHLAFYAILPL